jgi:hypothetical protein
MSPHDRAHHRRLLLLSGINALLVIPAFFMIWSLDSSLERLVMFLMFCALLGNSLGYHYCMEILEIRERRRQLLPRRR